MNDKRVVLVTGASRGIGREIALEFGRAGCCVALGCATGKEKAEAVAAEIEKSGGRAFVVRADVTDREAVRRMVSDSAEKEGRLDVLVNNAAICRDRTILKMSSDEWHDVLRTDLDGAFYVLQACSKLMAKQHGGSIINIASIAGVRGNYGGANYASAKAGLIALSKTAARELGRFSVRVNAVLPGFHVTDMSRALPKEFADKVKDESALGLTTDVHELARFVVFLSEMKTVSGQIFNWDSRIL